MRTLAIGLLALGAAACGGDLNKGATTDSSDGDVVVAETKGSFLAALDEWRLDIPLDTLPAGRYTFEITNTGSRTHAMDIVGTDGAWKTDPVTPLRTATLEVTLQPGTYEVYCPVEDALGDHDKLGMRRTLVVR